MFYRTSLKLIILLQYFRVCLILFFCRTILNILTAQQISKKFGPSAAFKKHKILFNFQFSANLIS